VLVSQGIEIYRTKSQENAVNMVKKENDEYFDYCQRCADNYERPADNYIDLEIEYPSEKEKDKEIERLTNIINELEKWLKECKDMCVNYTFDETYECEYNYYQQIAIADFIKSFILNKLQELKGEDKEWVNIL